ncbi:hypothetical protein [Endozoicomonas sp. ONNA1]|uniref:hypothetical protein n=1 Tax=Endozoicomonas sp. ONNA1 TaxID=2828740 RepID=UPI00214775CF|nr:hypothetical protein [Endozoicomonas sp. ONNA1]
MPLGPITPPLDTEWARQAFLLPREAIDDLDLARRYASSADQKFTDTTLGGSYAINMPPQFTRFADPKVKGTGSVSKGMGRYYSEAIDDSTVLVNMRFGVAEFNSLTTFFTKMYDPFAGKLARTGEASSIFYKIGTLAGFVTTIPLLPFTVAGRMIRFFGQAPYSKYYYLKPTMPLYWGAVNQIVNAMAVNLGISPSVWNEGWQETGTGEKIADISQSSLTTDDIRDFNRILPDVFRGDGGIDIRKVATRAQRMEYERSLRLTELFGNIRTAEELYTAINAEMSRPVSPKGVSLSHQDYLKRYFDSPVGRGNQEPLETDAEPDNVGEWESDSFFDYLRQELKEGSAWVSFRTTMDKTVSESFSNSVGESSIAQKINSMSGSNKEKKFSFMGGNIGDGIIASTVEAAVGAVADLAKGALNGVGMSGLVTLMGGAFVDIPQQWQDSSASLPKVDYKMELRATYGNKMSIFTDIYIPLAMILAAALPLSTGQQTYTSPFLCEAYCKGRSQVRLGIVDNLSITRGVGNLGWSDDDLPLAVDVSFSVVDLSSVMHMPIDSSLRIFDDPNAFTDYMAVLGSLGLSEQIRSTQMLKRNLAKIYEDFETWTSKANIAMALAHSAPGQWIQALSVRATRR